MELPKIKATKEDIEALYLGVNNLIEFNIITESEGLDIELEINSRYNKSRI